MPNARPFTIAALPAALVPVTNATQHQMAKTNQQHAETIKHITAVFNLNRAPKIQLAKSIYAMYFDILNKLYIRLLNKSTCDVLDHLEVRYTTLLSSSLAANCKCLEGAYNPNKGPFQVLVKHSQGF